MIVEGWAINITLLNARLPEVMSERGKAIMGTDKLTILNSVAKAEAFTSSGMDEIETPAFLTKPDGPSGSRTAIPREGALRRPFHWQSGRVAAPCHKRRRSFSGQATARISCQDRGLGSCD
ncbi:MAG: hypothetical protein V9H26_03970 [Verrucomicrobiota bacterium]|jgi:hypothetical protein